MNGQQTEIQKRILLETTLNATLSLIPAALTTHFLDFHERSSRRTLARLILLAHITYLLYGIVDWLIIDDVRIESMVMRIGLSLLLAYPSYFMIRYARVQSVDLFMPYAALLATMCWFYLLHISNSPDLNTYIYASLVFVIIANLGVQVYFLPSLVPSLLITLVTFSGVYNVTEANWRAIQIFSVVYFPVLGVSLFISITTTLKNRRTFLRRALNEWHRNALDELAHTDMLTSLPNRRQFERLAQNELARMQRKYDPACLIIFDVDRFKQINDNYGHDVGDRVLQLIADITQNHWRSYDIVARFGGEEFVGLLPNTQLDHALKITDRLREKIQNAELHLPDGRLIHFTISAGVIEVPIYLLDLKALIKLADQALYRAKKNGRNCIEAAEAEPQADI